MMNKSPLVSIIIPTYNRAHLIGETLDSIIGQTYRNWECIVVDDGSNDDTEALMKTYYEKDERIQYYHRPEGFLPGGNGARNFGFMISKGEYVQWFDSDDLMVDEKIKTQVQEALKKKVDLVISNFSFLNSNTPPQKLFLTDLLKFHIAEGTINTPMCFFKKSKIRDFKFDENLYRCQEFEFFTRIFFKKDLTFSIVNLPLSKIRQQANTITSGYFNGEKKFIESSLRCKYYAYTCSIKFDVDIQEIALYKFKIALWKAALFKHEVLYWSFLKLFFESSSNLKFTTKIKLILFSKFYFLTNRGGYQLKNQFFN